MSKNQDMDSATGALALADGTVFAGHGAGASGIKTGELCFNTAMTGYQEILTDPSYAQQLVLFTFPHIGNVGANPEDHEESTPPAGDAARGAIFREPITAPSNWRAAEDFGVWLARKGIIGLSGVDTRALTRRIRELGMPKAAICHQPEGGINFDALIAAAKAWPGLDNADLAADVVQQESFEHTEGLWKPGKGHVPMGNAEFHVVVVDFGVKKNILRNLANVGGRATVLNGNATAADVLALKPDGVVFSNGPGDPAATYVRSGAMIRELIASGIPILGICLGHQMLALALGAKTMKMAQGHHGANHPVKDLDSGKVEITSQNHGFAVNPDSLPADVRVTHLNLYDGTVEGFRHTTRPVFSVQYHPEASPGPHDADYLFQQFLESMEER